MKPRPTVTVTVGAPITRDEAFGRLFRAAEAGGEAGVSRSLIYQITPTDDVERWVARLLIKVPIASADIPTVIEWAREFASWANRKGRQNARWIK